MNQYSFCKKNILLLCLLFFAGWGAAKAQGFVGKIYVGINSTQLDGDEFSGYNKSGILAGLGAEYFFNERFSVQPSVFYSRKGARSGRNDPFFFSRRVNYIDIPVFLNIFLIDRLYLNLGLSGAYLLNADFESELGGRIDQTKFFYNWDYLYHAGVSYNVTDHLEVSVKLSYSLAKAAPAALWNNVLSFTGAYVLGNRSQ